MNDNLNPDTSPTDLLKKPSSKIGVKKLNKLPLMIVIGATIVVFLSLGYAMYQRGQMNHIKQDEKEDKSKVDGDPNAIVTSLLQQLRDREEMKKSATALKVDNKPQMPVAIKENKDLGMPTDKQIRVAIDKKVEEMRKRKEKLLLDAITAPTKLKTQAPLNIGIGATNGRSLISFQQNNRPVTTPGVEMAEKLLSTLNSSMKQEPDRVLKNENWMKHAKRSYDYIDSKKSKPISKYEIKAGTVIPGILITAINSELPGQVLGQVSENVYDTATGRYLLIPQGTKVVGIYNSDVAYGQNRVMIAWNRLIFPDGQTLNIGAMNGTDQSAAGGFEDQVDHHYFRIFGSAFLLSILGGEIYFEDGKIKMASSNNYYQPETVMQRTASKMIEKNMDIAPTIKIRSGYKFNIFVTKDIILEPLQYSVDVTDYNEEPQYYGQR